jgi:hypothetical protein
LKRLIILELLAKSVFPRTAFCRRKDGGWRMHVLEIEQLICPSGHSRAAIIKDERSSHRKCKLM